MKLTLATPNKPAPIYEEIVVAPVEADLASLKAKTMLRVDAANDAALNFGKKAIIVGLSLLEVRRAVLAQARGKALLADSPLRGEPSPQRGKIIIDDITAAPDETFDAWLAKDRLRISSGTAYRWMDCAAGAVCFLMGIDVADKNNIPLETHFNGERRSLADMLASDVNTLPEEGKLLWNKCETLIAQGSIRSISALACKEKTAPLSWREGDDLCAFSLNSDFNHVRDALILGQRLQELYARDRTLRPHSWNGITLHCANPPDPSRFAWWSKKYLAKLDAKDNAACATIAAHFTRFCFSIEAEEQIPISVQSKDKAIMLSAVLSSIKKAELRLRRKNPNGIGKLPKPAQGQKEELQVRNVFQWHLCTNLSIVAWLNHALVNLKSSRPSPLKSIFEVILDQD